MGSISDHQSEALPEPSPGSLADKELAYWTQVVPAIKGVVVHLDDADVPRPEFFGSIEWIGSVEPNNAEDYDTLKLIP